MALLVNGAESGTADGTTVTAANSGGGPDNAFDAVTIQGTNALTFDSQRAHGDHAYKWVPQNLANVTRMSWTSGLGVSRLFGRIYIWGASNPVANWAFVRLLNNAIELCSIQITTTGKVRVLDKDGTTLATSTNSIVLSAWNRIEFDFTLSTTVGQYVVSLYSSDSTTAVETLTGTSNHNFADISVDTVQWVNPAATNQGSAARTWYLDDLQVNSTGMPGPGSDRWPAHRRVTSGPSIAVRRAANW